MSTPSPAVLVKDGAGAFQSPPLNATPSDTITIALASLAGVVSWSITCVGTDETNSASAVTASLAINSISQTATFTAPAAGSALIFKSTVNSGVDVNGVVQPTYSTTFGIYTLTSGGLRVHAINETFESDPVFGWISSANAQLRAPAGSFTAGGDLTGTASSQQVVSATGSAGVLALATTAANVRWATATTSPKLSQADNTTASGVAQALTVNAQNATGTTSTGGDLNLCSGSGTSTQGRVNFQIAGTTVLQVLSSNTLSFPFSITSPIINQGTTGTNSATGQTFAIQAQTATGTTSTGGALSLTGGSGTSTGGAVTVSAGAATTSGTGGAVNISTGTGSTNPGNLNLQVGGSTLLSLLNTSGSPNAFQWATGVTTPTINQAANSTNSATGQPMVIKAQNATGTTSTGGLLQLSSGSGTSTHGIIALQIGGVTKFTLTATGGIQLANFATAGLVHNDASGNFTTSTLVNADVASNAAISYSKLGGTGSETINPQTFVTGINAKGTATYKEPVNLQTTTATTTTLDSFTLASGTAVSWVATVTAIKSDFTQGASYTVSAAFRNNAGTVSQIGATSSNAIGTDNTSLAVTMNNSGTTIQLQVTGIASATWQWTSISTQLAVIP